MLPVVTTLKSKVLGGRVIFEHGHDGHKTYALRHGDISERATDVSFKTGPGFEVLQVKFHNTLIVEVSDENITLDAGVGSHTPFSTGTKRRMNQAAHEFSLGYHVWDDAGRWYVSSHGLTREFPRHGVVQLRG
jgi:hypothetical protein